MNETVKTIIAALEKAEQTHRAHGRALAELHRALAQGVTDHGAALGVGEETMTLAAAPKIPPPNV